MTVQAVAGQTVATDLTRLYGQNEESTPDNGLGKDAFLKLLVAQLKYQDPMNPSSSEDFIATTAQFTVVEKLDELTKQGSDKAMVSSLTTASALIGKEITVAGADGLPLTSLVERTQLIGGEVTVITGLGPVALDQIIGVGKPGTSSTDTSSTDTSSTDTSSTDTSSTDTSSTDTSRPKES